MNGRFMFQVEPLEPFTVREDQEGEWEGIEELSGEEAWEGEARARRRPSVRRMRPTVRRPGVRRPRPRPYRPRPQPRPRPRPHYPRPHPRPRPRPHFPYPPSHVTIIDRRPQDGYGALPPTEPPPEGSEYIRWVQSSLNAILGLRLALDGAMGPETRSAVRSFQKKQGLPVDGIVGPDTERALIAARRSRPAASGQELETMWSDRALEMEVNRRSRDYVRWVQRSLNKILGLSLAVDGLVGRKTRSAIRRFQERAGLKADGIVGSKTEAAIQAALRTVDASTAPRTDQDKLPELSSAEQRAFNSLGSQAQSQFSELRRTIETYADVARREADRGSRVLLQRGVFRAVPRLLPELIRLTKITNLPPGWTIARTKPLLVGNVLYNLAFPETINQGGYDRLGGTPDPTCFSASTQILLARRFPATYVRYVIDLATTQRVRFAGGDNVGPLTFVSTSLYKSLDSVLLQTAFDTYFDSVSPKYRPGDELKVHRQVFGPDRPPTSVTWKSKTARIVAFRWAFTFWGGSTPLWEIANLCTRSSPESTSPCGNHTVVVTRIANDRVYFYNPWANEEERKTMFGSVWVTVSGNGERPAESSMSQADFENQLTAVFHN